MKCDVVGLMWWVRCGGCDVVDLSCWMRGGCARTLICCNTFQDENAVLKEVLEKTINEVRWHALLVTSALLVT